METVAAFSLAGTIAQFLQFSLELFSRSKQLYRSSQGALSEAVNTEVIAKDIIKRVQLLKAEAVLAGQDIDEDLQLLCDSSVAVAEELLSILERVRVKKKRQIWPSFKAAILSVRTQRQVKDLKKRLDALAQQVQLCAILTFK